MERVGVRYAPSDNIERDWPFAAPLLAAALEHDPYNSVLVDVEAALLFDRCALWVGEKSAAVVEPDYEGKLVQLWLAGGDLTELKKMLADLETWACARNFKRVMLYGRKGWQKTMRDIGYRHKWTVLEKILWAD